MNIKNLKHIIILLCVESDLEQKENAEIHFKEAIKLAKETEEYDHLAKNMQTM